MTMSGHPHQASAARLAAAMAMAMAACGSIADTTSVPVVNGSAAATFEATPSTATSAGTPTQSPSIAVGTAVPATAAAAAVVKQTNEFLFVPDALTVRVGDVVAWTNTGGIGHNVVFLDQPSLASPLMNKGDVWAARFTTAGTFTYVCQPHRAFGMTGTITVAG